MSDSHRGSAEQLMSDGRNNIPIERHDGGIHRRLGAKITFYRQFLAFRNPCSSAALTDAKNTRRPPSLVRLGKISETEARIAIDRDADARRAVQRQHADHTVGHLWQQWMLKRERDQLSNKIYQANWVSLGAAFANRSAALLVESDWTDYAKARFALGRSPWTVQTELSRLRHCLKWAVRNVLSSASPLLDSEARQAPRDCAFVRPGPGAAGRCW